MRAFGVKSRRERSKWAPKSEGLDVEEESEAGEEDLCKYCNGMSESKSKRMMAETERDEGLTGFFL